MKNMKNKYLLVFAVVSLTTVSSFAFQGGAPPNPTPPGLPIDGFVSIILAAGAFFGVKSLRRKK